MSDPDVLEWAAQDNRVLLTHDVTTLLHFANERLRDGLKMPGIIAIERQIRVSEAIEDLLLIDEGSQPSDWNDLVRFLPLR